MSKNYNAGKVVINCEINSYCPFESSEYVDNTIVLNSETVKGLSDTERSRISFVDGEQGIFLKEKLYNYNSQWLYINGEPLCNEYFSLYQETAGGGSFINTSSIEAYHFSWDLTRNVFSSLSDPPLSVRNYSTVNSSQSTDNTRWRCESETVTLGDGNKERKDGRVLMPVACVANPSKTKGGHWRVRKITSLFRGEDFFVEFRRKTKSLDNSNVGTAPFSNYSIESGDSDIYKTIDSRFSGNVNGLPINGGVVGYRAEVESGTITFKVIDESRDIYDLNNQAYVVVEMGIHKDFRYFIIITEKGRPRFIKTVKDGGAYRSICLSEYQLITGSNLFSVEKFRVSVRNHLGKIVITFNDLDPWVIENIPTTTELGAKDLYNSNGTSIQTEGDIIAGAGFGASAVEELAKADARNFMEEKVQENAEAKNGNGPDALFVVPDAPIAIWGGNMSLGFLFSPIVYEEEAKIILPTSNKEKMVTDGKVETYPFVLPLPASHHIFLSQRSIGMDNAALPRSSAEGQAGKLIKDAADPLAKHFYTCDCQLAGVIRYSNEIDENEPYFMDYGDYIKEQSFPSSIIRLGLKDGIFDTVQNDIYSKSFYIELFLQAGGHIFDNGWILPGCKTPIANIIRLVSVPDTEDAWPTKTIDASGLVLSYNDSWSSTDFTKMEHSATIRFLINKGREDDALRKDVEALKNKAFYINIDVGYNGCNYVGTRAKGEIQDPDDDGIAITRMMTGICYGGVITEKAGERVMECKVFDYSKILEQALIFNSPFFDGVRDINAIYELSKMVAFKENTMGDPAFLLARAVEKTKDSNEYGGGDGLQSPDGRIVTKSKVYALPHGYNILQGGALFRFSDGDNMASAMDKIGKRSGKVLFFDNYGMLHYESFPIAGLLFNPEISSSSVEGNVPSKWKFSVSPLTEGTILLHSQLQRENVVSELFNNIFIFSSTPRQEFLFADSINKKSIKDPTSEGFIGYRKTFYQAEGIFGDENAVNNYAKHLTKFYRPPVVYKFETFGVPMRAFDIAEVDGQKMIIVNVSHNIDAKENKWWMSAEGEWFNGETGESLT